MVAWVRRDTALAFATLLSVGVEGAQEELISFDVPGAVATRPFKVSPSGVVVGLYIDTANVVHGFRMKGGVFERIDGPAAIRTNATSWDGTTPPTVECTDISSATAS